MRPLYARAARWSHLRPIASSQTSLRQIRYFHPTRPAPFLNEVLEVSSAFLHGVHSVTGLPWVASIPLTAFIVRMAVAMPLQVYQRIHARRDRDLTHRILSWRSYYQRFITTNTQERLLPAEAQSRLRKDMNVKIKDLRKRWKVARFWKFAPFLQVPIWLSLMEGLRAMCGNNNGLIYYLMTFWGPNSTSTSPEQAITTVFEPSLATEGALWFPDLLAGDPTGVLPVILSASILLNVTSGWKTPTIRQISDFEFNWMMYHLQMRALKLCVQGLSIYVGWSAYMTGMPAGLMVYWIASTNIATLQSLFLDKYMFAIKPLKLWTQMYVGVLRPGEVRPPPPSQA
ncbi:hypothetical protein VTN77DRAFT_1250 [Rasamsonia byssochlamydoides]|uniref:uncharacterized protein n=1 Tax=Rasamsonia byssochlamydoides TaxID=89139 RepID=UPI00374340CF